MSVSEDWRVGTSPTIANNQVVSLFLCLPMSRRSSLLTGEVVGIAPKKIIRCQESMGFYKLFIVQSTLSKPVCKYEKMRKNCTHHHVVNISVLTIILILTICLHHYIGVTDI